MSTNSPDDTPMWKDDAPTCEYLRPVAMAQFRLAVFLICCALLATIWLLDWHDVLSIPVLLFQFVAHNWYEKRHRREP